MAEADGQGEAKYKAAEVCRAADVQPYVLRYWESEFPFLTPSRPGVGARSYTEHDLRLIRRIKQLLYDEGYTIAGAKKRLETELKKGVPLFEDAEIGEPDLGDEAIPRDVLVSPSTSKPKRKPKAAPPAAEPEPPSPDAEPFQELPAPVVEISAGDASDPRITRVVAELKEILSLLSQD